MDQQIIEDLDSFVGAFEEFIDLPGSQCNSIAFLLLTRLNDINGRIQQLHIAARSERSEQRAQVEAVS